MICGLPLIIIYSLIAEGNPLTFHWTWSAVVCVLYLTISGTIAAFWLYYWLLGKIESTKAMMISLVTPLLAVIIGWIVLGETLPPQTGLRRLFDHRQHRADRLSEKEFQPQRRRDAEARRDN